MKNTDNPIYKISFYNHSDVYEIYASKVYESDMFGFLVVEEIEFGQDFDKVIDPSEERLKTEFKHVKRSFIPTQSVVRIDEVAQRGSAKITQPSAKKNDNGVAHLSLLKDK